MSENLEVQALKEADVSFCITKALKDLMIRRGVTDKEIHVIPNAVDTEKFSPCERDEALAEELGVKNSVVIGYVGSVVNYEGLDDLLLAARKLKQRNIDYFKIVIVGDGASLDNLKELRKDYGLQNEVVFTGRVPHDVVMRYISIIDIMPFPRKPYLVCDTVSPLKPFESLAMEKPVIVSSCAALKEIIKHEKRGLVFKKGDVDDLADKLLTLIDNPGLRASLAKEGLRWVRAERDWKVIAGYLAGIYLSGDKFHAGV